MLGKSVRETIATQSASNPYQVNSLALGADTNPIAGVVKWDPVRSAWNGTNLVAAIALAPIYATWDAYRRLFGGERAYAVYRSFGRLSPSIGSSQLQVLEVAGESFLFGWVRQSAWVDRCGRFAPTTRADWAQRQPRCHDFLAHRHGLLKDGWWNLHCRLVLDNPPGFDPGPGIADDRFYKFLRTYLDVASTAYWLVFFSPSVAGLGWSGACSYGLRPAQQCIGSFHTLHIQEVRRVDSSMARECRRMTFLSPQFPRWVKAGTTITTPSPPRHDTASIRASQTLVSASFS